MYYALKKNSEIHSGIHYKRSTLNTENLDVQRVKIEL